MAGARSILAAALACCTGLAYAGPSSPSNGATRLHVTRTPADVAAAILAGVARLPPADPLARRYRQAYGFSHPLFPPDAELRGETPQPALTAWLALPPAQRRNDVVILPASDHYWRQDGTDYRATFIVHVTPAADGSDIAILQYGASTLHGKAFRLLGRTGPGRYLDIRPAAPSPAAAAELAAWLAGLAELAAPARGQQP
ncbi:hypothetical protein [Pseudoduganella armeniaca]|uniref:Uncharacterized protein n=1 Tax=Pseudoduganella armeniaca TaxID=2072590 RepID=A0A2R4C7V0_9BURK|nr:hypothetical protein [Pseudoduganella armeniaca]AVR95630.1 hypothetical protein C9I28_07725 [Pseudoduganella armeniaca]